MNWYLAKIIYRIVCGKGDHTPQFDEQLRLIHAVDTKAAYQKARQIGELEQNSFINQKQLQVQWQFVNIADLYTMNVDTDGAEVFSRIIEIKDPGNYICDIHKRSCSLLSGDYFSLTSSAT